MPGSVAEAVKDPQFLAAPQAQQMAYLSAIDPDFKAGKPEDRLAYLNHVTGKPAPTTANNSVENANTWKPMAGFTPGNLAGQAWEGLRQLGSSALEAGKDVLFPQGNTEAERLKYLGHKYIEAPAMAEEQKARNAKSPLESVGHSVASAIPIVGPWAASLGEQAGSGDVGGAVAKGATQVAAAEALPKVLPKVGEAIRDTPSTVERLSGSANAKLDQLGANMPETAKLITRVRNPGMSTVLDALKREPTAPAPSESPVVSTAPYKLTSPGAETEPAVQMPLEMPKAQPTVGPLEGRAGINRIGDLVQQGAGWKPLEPNVPIGQQLRAVGADVMPPGQIPPRAGVIPQMPLGSRVAVPISEEFGPMLKRPGEVGRAITEEPARQMGAPSLRPDVSLREQPKTAEAPVRSEQARMEEKYPDKADRQMAHANGEQIVDAIGHDPETMKAVHDLTNPDVRQAMINSGEDMGQISIGNRKATGNQMTRQEAFNRLLQKGLTPREIVRLARQPMEVTESVR
jgi:hypothetical protein